MSNDAVPNDPGFWRPDVDPAQDPRRVLLHWGELRDEARNGRVVPYKIYYPVYDEGQMPALPVVIWSHGLGGSRNGAGFIARYIAARGYVVMNIQHVGSDSTLWEGKPGHPWDVLRTVHIPRKTSLERFRDVPFAINSLPSIAAALTDVKIDTDSLGMSGHSFGALTTQVIAGQRLGKGDRMYQMADDRVKAAIAYSMSPAYNETEDPATIYSTINIPMMFMTGTSDDSPISGRDYTHRLPIFEYSKGPDQQLLVIKDGDHMVYNGSRGKLGDNAMLAVHERVIQITSLAFWDAYLRKDKAAKEWLTGGAFVAWLGDAAKYTFKENT